MTAEVKDNRKRLFPQTKTDKDRQRTPGDLPLTPAGTIRSRDICVILATGLHSGQAKQKGSDAAGSPGHAAGDTAPVARAAASHTCGTTVARLGSARPVFVFQVNSGLFLSATNRRVTERSVELPFTFICLTNTQSAKCHSKFWRFKVNFSIVKHKCWLTP